MKKDKDCRDCKFFEQPDYDTEGGYCHKVKAEVSDPKENYCNG